MKICIWGLTASGKTTLGNELCRELGIAHVNASYKKLTKDEKDLLSFLDAASGKYAREFDKDIIKEARGTDCVITTWHAPWIIKDLTVSVFLNVSEAERVRRIALEKRRSRRFAAGYIRSKDKKALGHYELAYGKKPDFSVFDIEINYGRVTKAEAVSIVSMLALMRDKKRYA